MSESKGNAKISVTVLNVKSPVDKKTVEMEKNAPISELTEMVAKHFNAQPSQLRLIFAGKILKDQDTLATYNIKDGSTVHLIIKTDASQNNPTTTSSTNTGSALIQRPPAEPFTSGMFDSIANMELLNSGRLIQRYVALRCEVAYISDYIASAMASNRRAHQYREASEITQRISLSRQNDRAEPFTSGIFDGIASMESLNSGRILQRYLALRFELTYIRHYIADVMASNRRENQYREACEIMQRILLSRQSDRERNSGGRMGNFPLNEEPQIDETVLVLTNDPPISHPLLANHPEFQSPSHRCHCPTPNANTTSNADSTVPNNVPSTEGQNNSFAELISRMRSQLQNHHPPRTVVNYGPQMEELIAMGFSNEEACLEALNASHGSIIGAADWLISHGY